MYTLEFTEQAIDDLRLLKHSEPPAYKKARKLLTELMEHPRTGTGKPEMKKYNFIVSSNSSALCMVRQ